MIRFWFLRILAPIVGRYPWPFYKLAWLAGWAAWITQNRLRRNLTQNLLPLCDGDLACAEREGLRAYRNVAHYWVDLTTVPHRKMEFFERDHLRIAQPERLAVLDQPGPIVVVSAHAGNAELAIQALTFRGRPFVALVEELGHRATMRYMLRLRSAAGASFYEANFRGVRACVEALKEGQIVGVMGDRDLQGTGVCVTLAGRRVRLPRGPWELARRTGATVLPVFSYRVVNDEFSVYVEEPFNVPCSGNEEDDIRAAAERWAVILETALRRHPGEWTVLEDFWRVHACG